MPIKPRRILCLEPYYGGSHQAFLDGWIRHSCHDWTVFTLPAYKWKWRMRHAPITLAQQVESSPGGPWDVIFASDMLNLAEFIGLSPMNVARLPRVVYFHENQLTYPQRDPRERDLHYAFTNLTTSLAADEVWFNSDFHRQDYVMAMREYLARMPDFQPLSAIDSVLERSSVHYPGIERIDTNVQRETGPLRIAWAARWEHDKNPEDFFSAIRILRANQMDMRLVVLGQSFEDSPPIFAAARREFHDLIDHWGYAHQRADYLRVLSSADVFVSTARHEFFGLSAAEAIACGLYPLLPNRLAYPELLAHLVEDSAPFLYNGSVPDLAVRLQSLSQRKQYSGLKTGIGNSQGFSWDRLVPVLDNAISNVSS